jgi:hypothetical protein
MYFASLENGRSYLNRNGEQVKIKSRLSRQDFGYDKGFRFVDSEGRTYKNRGGWATDGETTGYDLVDLVE